MPEDNSSTKNTFYWKDEKRILIDVSNFGGLFSAQVHEFNFKLKFKAFHVKSYCEIT
jgi:hypothetical protein